MLLVTGILRGRETSTWSAVEPRRGLTKVHQTGQFIQAEYDVRPAQISPSPGHGRPAARGEKHLVGVPPRVVAMILRVRPIHRKENCHDPR
jgi:hypothetical protein